MKWKPQDVIALIVVTGCLTLIGLGYDGPIKYTLMGVVGVYYGLDLTPLIKLGRIQKPPKEGGPNGE